VKITQDVIQDILKRRKSIRFRELRNMLLESGFEMRQQKRGGSHYVFKHPRMGVIVVLVAHGKDDMLPEYQVMKAIKAIERLEPQ